jgi:hypothetical protein
VLCSNIICSTLSNVWIVFRVKNNLDTGFGSFTRRIGVRVILFSWALKAGATRASVVTHVVTSVKKCARASYVGIYLFISISTTDVTKCVTTDAFCALVWPQP